MNDLASHEINHRNDGKRFKHGHAALKNKKSLLLLEYVTGGGLCDLPMIDISSSLMKEGDVMLAALLRDCQEALGNHSITVMRDARLEPLSGADCITVNQDFTPQWLTQLRLHDTVWIIAPETDDVLLQLVCDAHEVGTQTINASEDAIAICSSKQRTAQQLQGNGVACVPSFKANELHKLDAQQALMHKVVVCKPDDGAGCIDTRRYENLSQLTELAPNYIVQPYVQGEALSLCAWCDADNAKLLSVNEQFIRCDASGVFHFEGCKVNVPHRLHERFEVLMRQVHCAVPGLHGPIGIDVMLTPDDELVVMEINPRMTTSFAALWQARSINLAALAFDKLNAGITSNWISNKTIEIRV
jgi:tyramine---L-glutamate ligase